MKKLPATKWTPLPALFKFLKLEGFEDDLLRFRIPVALEDNEIRARGKSESFFKNTLRHPIPTDIWDGCEVDWDAGQMRGSHFLAPEVKHTFSDVEVHTGDSLAWLEDVFSLNEESYADGSTTATGTSAKNEADTIWRKVMPPDQISVSQAGYLVERMVGEDSELVRPALATAFGHKDVAIRAVSKTYSKSLDHFDESQDQIILGASAASYTLFIWPDSLAVLPTLRNATTQSFNPVQAPEELVLEALIFNEKSMEYNGVAYPWGASPIVLQEFPNIFWHKMEKVTINFEGLLKSIGVMEESSGFPQDAKSLSPEGFIGLPDLIDIFVRRKFGSSPPGLPDVYENELGRLKIVRNGKDMRSQSQTYPMEKESARLTLHDALSSGGLRGLVFEEGEKKQIPQIYWGSEESCFAMYSGIYNISILDKQPIYFREDSASEWVESNVENTVGEYVEDASEPDADNVIRLESSKSSAAPQRQEPANEKVPNSENVLSAIKKDLTSYGKNNISEDNEEKINLWAKWCLELLERMPERNAKSLKAARAELLGRFCEETRYSEGALESQPRKYLGKDWYTRY